MWFSMRFQRFSKSFLALQGTRIASGFGAMVRTLIVSLIAATVPAIAAATDGAQVVSADLPTALGCGATTSASVTMRNTGTTTWTSDVYKLGPVGDSDEVGGPARVYLPAGAEIPPGGEHTFTFNLTAPTSERIATTDWRMVHEGVAWFGGIAARSVSITCSSNVDNAQIVAATLPNELACGQSFEASVTVRNSGGTTWTANVYKLGRNGDDDDLNGPARVYLPPGAEVPPGGQHTFPFTLTAPSVPGTALTDWRMVHDGVAWFGQTASRTLTVDCSDPIDDAIVIDADLPDFLNCGEAYAASVTMRNTGTTTWASDVFKLGAVGDVDLFGGPLRVYLPGGTTVPPGSEHTFEFTLTAPFDLGGAPSKWRMVHENVAWFGSIAHTWVDLECGCEAGGCAAGCAHVPAFTVSTTRIPTHEPVTFTVASPDTILDELPNWDFGDGNHCDHCPRTVIHSYTTAGVYRARLTATESRCGSVVVSNPIEIEAFGHAVPRQNAEVIETDFPSALCDGTYPARVTVRNIGNGPWMPGEYFLGAVGDSDPFSESNRIPLTTVVQPQDVHTFEFPLRAAHDSCPFSPCRTEWQMVWENHFWFGGTARRDIEVGACTTPGEGDYTCIATARDEYGTPLSGKAVVLETYEYGDDKWELIDRAVGATNAAGEAVVSMTMSIPAPRLKCRVDLGAMGRNTVGVIFDNDGLPVGSVVYVDALAVPEPTFSHAVLGRNGASAVGHLYQSGEYDRVVVIPEPFNPNELAAGPRGREGLWQELKPFMVPLYDGQFDVWVVNPPSTGQNIHEQAAELAEVIEYATRGFPTANGSAPAFDGQAAVVGISLGGVVTRIATSRWESRASEDAAWRAQLGLANVLPLKLIVFVDSPLRGANVPESLQSFLWAPYGFPMSQASQINMSSCAFHQMVKLQAYEPFGCPPHLADASCNWESFYTKGRQVQFPGFGTCDSRSDGICRCEAGPAVFSINGDGFAHGPRTIAYSDGKPGEHNQCYGDDRDLTRDGKNLCGSDPSARILWVGDEWLKLDANNFPDRHFFLRQSDLVPGSRLPGLDGRTFNNIISITARQFSSPTFIPLTSSYGTGSEACGFFDCQPNDFNGSHVNPSEESQDWLFGHVMNVFGPPFDSAPAAARTDGPYSSEPGQPLSLNAVVEGPLDSISWDLGDGTVRSGSSIAHTYQRAGIYPIEVIAELTGVGSLISRTTARIGIPENQPPQIDPMPNIAAAPGETVELTAEATDEGTEVVRTFWNFGDGDFGEGETTTHSWSEPGTYTVIFSATDAEAATSTTEFTASVGTPVAPAPIAPVMAGTGVEPLFSWQEVQGVSSYTLRVISESSGDLIQVSIDAVTSSDGSPSRATLDEPLAAGDHSWSVSATNEYGEGPPSEWARFRVQTSRNNPPTVSVETTEICTSSCTVTLTAIAHDSDGDAVSFSWAGCGSGSEATLECETAGPGSISAIVTVTDTRGATAAAEVTIPVFAAAYDVGRWGQCSAACGGGVQARSVAPSAVTLTPPGVEPPPATRPCNTQACGLTCYDYTNMYPTKVLCFSDGWTVCERRYRGDGIGGTLTCWKGFK